MAWYMTHNNVLQMTLAEEGYANQVFSLAGTPVTDSVTITVLDVYPGVWNSGFSDIHFLEGKMLPFSFYIRKVVMMVLVFKEIS